MSFETLDYGELIQKLTKLAQNNDPIDTSLYQKFDVKRGLRYADGRGVLVGLTHIGDVVGYEMDENGNKVAIPGRLIYVDIQLKTLFMTLRKTISLDMSSAFTSFFLENCPHSSSWMNLPMSLVR